MNTQTTKNTEMEKDIKDIINTIFDKVPEWSYWQSHSKDNALVDEGNYVKSEDIYTAQDELIEALKKYYEDKIIKNEFWLDVKLMPPPENEQILILFKEYGINDYVVRESIKRGAFYFRPSYNGKESDETFYEPDYWKPMPKYFNPMPKI